LIRSWTSGYSYNLSSTNEDRSLGDADESEEASSGILMGKKAGFLFISLVGIEKV